MGLGGAETTEDVLRAASLCALLPRGARVRRAENPDEDYGLTEQLLMQVEYDLRCVIHALCAKRGDKRPEPIRLPSEAERAREVAEQAERARGEIDEILGFANPEGGHGCLR